VNYVVSRFRRLPPANRSLGPVSYHQVATLASTGPLYYCYSLSSTPNDFQFLSKIYYFEAAKRKTLVLPSAMFSSHWWPFKPFGWLYWSQWCKDSATTPVSAYYRMCQFFSLARMIIFWSQSLKSIKVNQEVGQKWMKPDFVVYRRTDSRTHFHSP